jgi:PTH1 family peptidyl-tRNA hydrolase
VVLAKPTTYMNVSGGPVAALAKYYDVPPERTVLVHDELDIPFADVRLKRGGGEGGHNGLRGHHEGARDEGLRRACASASDGPRSDGPGGLRAARLREGELKDLPWLLDAAADAVELVVTQGLEAASSRCTPKADAANPSKRVKYG